MDTIALIIVLIGIGIFGLGLWAGIINEKWPGFFACMAVGVAIVWFGSQFS